MTDETIASAKTDIESTTDLLERALKLSGLITSLFAERGFKLVVVGGSAVEFYTEGGYMSGDIDFCRKTLNAIPPRVMQEVVAKLGGKGVAWAEAERLAASPDFAILDDFRRLRQEVSDGLAK